MKKDELEKRISTRFDEMPPKIRQAARYVMDAPKDIALQSMRAVAARAQLQPASMLRLARDLGFASYEDFRAIYIEWLSKDGSGMLERAEKLRQRSQASGGDDRLLADFLGDEFDNLHATLGQRNETAFREATKILNGVKRIYVLGLRSFYPPAFHLHYVLSTFLDNVTLLSGTGNTLPDELRRIGKKDAMVCFSARPYANASIEAARHGRQKGAKIVAITDSHLSPIGTLADTCIVAPNTSLSLFPSILPAVAVAQTLAQLLIAHGGKNTLAEIANSEAQLHQFDIFHEND